MSESSPRRGRPGANAFLLKRALASGGPVLELFAGAGELTRTLTEAGLEVTGVEPQEPPARIAELARPQQTTILREDPRWLRLSQRFELVLAVGSALRRPSTLDELEQVLATAAAHLSPQGVFLLEIDGLSTRCSPRERPVMDHRTGLATAVRANPATGRAIHAPHLARRGMGRAQISRLSLLALAPTDLLDRLDAVGLKPLETLGDFDERPFDIDCPRLIVTSSLIGSV